jgi:hypothetical protein
VRCGWGGEGIRKRDLWNIDGWMDRKRDPVGKERKGVEAIMHHRRSGGRGERKRKRRNKAWSRTNGRQGWEGKIWRKPCAE